MSQKQKVKKVNSVTVGEFFQRHSEELGLTLISGEQGLERPIIEPTINRPGLALAGFFTYFAEKRIQAFGHGTRSELSAERAMDIATEEEPRPLPAETQDEEWIGQPVSIAPSDYWKEPVTGVLVASSAHSWVLERRLTASSNVNVHFPKQGFALETGMA